MLRKYALAHWRLGGRTVGRSRPENTFPLNSYRLRSGGTESTVGVKDARADREQWIWPEPSSGLKALLGSRTPVRVPLNKTTDPRIAYDDMSFFARRVYFSRAGRAKQMKRIYLQLGASVPSLKFPIKIKLLILECFAIVDAIKNRG